MWSKLVVSGIPIEEYCQELQIKWSDESRKKIAEQTRTMGMEIIKAKGRTHYGIATSVCFIADAIINQRPTIASVSSQLMGEHGVRGVSLSVPSVIGPGGKQIRAIIDASGAEIDIQDSGVVTITSNDQEGAAIAKRMIEEITFKPQEGMIRKGKVVRIIPIGAFVELAPGKDGMVHISQVCKERIDTIEPHLNVGDEVIVKVIKIDEKGRVNLTIKGVTDEEKASIQ